MLAIAIHFSSPHVGRAGMGRGRRAAMGCGGLNMDFGFWKTFVQIPALPQPLRRPCQALLQSAIFTSESAFKDAFHWELL